MNKNIQYRKLTDICEIITGEWGTEISENSQNIASIIRTTNFLNNGKIDIENKELIKREIDKKKIEQKQLKRGDIIIEKSGGSPNQPVGRVVFFDLNSNEIFLCNNFTSILRVKEDINSKYVFYFFRNSYKNKKVLKFQNKTTGIINLKLQNYLNESHIFLPELKIQNKRVDILDNLENIIEKNQNYLIHLRELTKSLFTKFNKNGVEKQLNDVADIIMGQSPLSQSYNKDKKGLPFYQGKTEFSDIYIKEPTVYCNSPIKVVEENDILMSVRAPVGDVNIATQKSCIGRGLASIKPKKIDYLYLFYLLKEQKSKIEKIGVGSTFKAINKNNISTLKISIVEKDKQNKIRNYLSSIEKLKFTIMTIILKAYKTMKKRGVEKN
ncbi:restriction endonuclease subunit S [Fusobacterium periodonticum]|uniref:Type I restriction enzyme, S subunit n=1 Tax=Fusobacterium periodonticum 2_1_31 TaxID=469599 RepID=A0ABR4WNL4_9FUSO|nr:restriction endonuclease subunit S [Fusobacterium periodonticum]KGE63485.1 type I restriction enzyme, S subunit [Fusobacterium periodonticum 2_1_31]